MNKIVSIHQPNYIPWLGYFYKIANSDIFVYLDIVQYPRGQSFAARNKIKTPNGSTYLTIPVSIPGGKKGKALYIEVIFADESWKGRHLKTVELNYKKAPYFKEIFEIYSSQLDRSHSLTELNINLIEAFCHYLEIPTKRIRLSDILTDFGQKTDLIVDICIKTDSTIYLSGDGSGREYNDEKLLNQNGIELTYADFNSPVYSQLWGEFKSNLSIIDLLFNCGNEIKSYLYKS